MIFFLHILQFFGRLFYFKDSRNTETINKMNTYYLRFFLIPFILCALICNANAHEAVSIDSDACQMALLNHRKALPIFFDAIDQNDIDKLLTFKDMNWDLHTSYQNGQGLLYQASYLGKIEIVHTLVSEIGIDVNSQDPENGLTALHYAVLNTDPSSRIDTIYALVQLGADVDILNNLEYKPSQDAEDREKPQFEYSMEQKIKAAELTTLPPHDIPISQIAKLLQIKYNTLRNWVNKYKEQNGIQRRKLQSHSQKQKTEAIKMNIEYGMIKAQIAEKLGISSGTVFSWVSQYKQEHGILTQKSYSQELKNEAINMVIKNKILQTQVAKDLNVPKSTLSDWLNEYRKEHNIPTQPKGYSQEIKDKAIELFKSGMKISQIAEKLGISRSTISNWTHEYRKEHNIPTQTQQYESKKLKAIEMFKSGMSVAEIAEELEIPKITLLRRWFRPYREEHNQERQKLKDKVIRMFRHDMNDTQIAEKLGISRSTISNWTHEYRKEHNIPTQTQQYESKKLKAIEMFKSGISATKIAEKLNVSRNTVSKWLRPYKDQRRQEPKNKAIEMFKSNVSTAKIIGELRISARTLRRWLRPYNEEQNQKHQKLKDKVINMYKSGMKISQIAEKLGISRSTISNWTHEYRKEHNIPTQTQQYESKKLKAIEMFKSGISATKIAEKLNVSRNTVSK